VQYFIRLGAKPEKIALGLFYSPINVTSYYWCPKLKVYAYPYRNKAGPYNPLRMDFILYVYKVWVLMEKPTA
jgi:hypothetical protein